VEGFLHTNSIRVLLVLVGVVALWRLALWLRGRNLQKRLSIDGQSARKVVQPKVDPRFAREVIAPTLNATPAENFSQARATSSLSRLESAPPKFDPKFAREVVGHPTDQTSSPIWGLRNTLHTIYPHFVAVDVETTGLRTATCKIIEIALIEFRNGKPTSEFVSFVNPGVAIPPPATRKNNITDAMVRGAPSFEVIARDRRFLELLGKPLVGHNLQFDLDFLRAELKRVGVFVDLQWGFCTMRRQVTPPSRGSSSRREPGRYDMSDRWRKLDFAMSEWSVRRDGALHRAKVDAIAAGKVACRMMEREMYGNIAR